MSENKYPINEYGIETNIRYDTTERFFFVQFTVKSVIPKDIPFDKIFVEFMVPMELIIPAVQNTSELRRQHFREANSEEKNRVGIFIPEAELKVMRNDVSKTFHLYFKIIGLHLSRINLSSLDTLDFSIPIEILNAMVNRAMQLMDKGYTEEKYQGTQGVP